MEGAGNQKPKKQKAVWKGSSREKRLSMWEEPGHYKPAGRTPEESMEGG